MNRVLVRYSAKARCRASVEDKEGMDWMEFFFVLTTLVFRFETDKPKCGLRFKGVRVGCLFPSKIAFGTRFDVRWHRFECT